MGVYAGQIATIVLLIVLNGFFAAAEISLVSARRIALQAAADKGSSGARAALKLLDDPNRLLSTVSVAITLVGFSAASLAAVTFEQPFAAYLASLGVPALGAVSSGLAVFIVTVVITYLTTVFGELAPKRLGLQRSLRVAQAVAKPVTWLSVAMSPLVWVLGRSTDVVARILGVAPFRAQKLVEQRAKAVEEQRKGHQQHQRGAGGHVGRRQYAGQCFLHAGGNAVNVHGDGMAVDHHTVANRG
jgi:putative hemolysin